MWRKIICYLSVIHGISQDKVYLIGTSLLKFLRLDGDKFFKETLPVNIRKFSLGFPQLFDADYDIVALENERHCRVV